MNKEHMNSDVRSFAFDIRLFKCSDFESYLSVNPYRKYDYGDTELKESFLYRKNCVIMK